MMKRLRSALPFGVWFALTSSLVICPAQGLFRLSCSPPSFGATLAIRVEGAASGSATLYASLAPTSAGLPTPFGPLWLDPASLFELASLAHGTSSVVVIPIPPTLPPPVIPLFVQAVCFDPSMPTGIQLTNPLRIALQPSGTVDTTAPALVAPRAFATATELADGRTLIVGGGGGSIINPVGSDAVESYDPFSGLMRTEPSMTVTRALHTAVRLQNGRVLVTGGVESPSATVTSTAEIFDPLTNRWSPAASMSVPRAGHSSILLPDGCVLCVGGTPAPFVAQASSTGLIGLAAILNAAHNSGEVYNPHTNTWRPVSNLMSAPRLFAGATMIGSNPGPASGLGLIVGGFDGATAISSCLTAFGPCIAGTPANPILIEIPTLTRSCDYYDPTSNAFSPAPSLMGDSRAGFALVRTPTGMRSERILVVGGLTTDSPFRIPRTLSSSEFFDTNVAVWRPGPNLPNTAVLPQARVLADGTAVLAGGFSGSFSWTTGFSLTALNQVLRWNGAIFSPLPSLPVGTGANVLSELPDGRLFLSGGLTIPSANTGIPTDLSLIINP